MASRGLLIFALIVQFVCSGASTADKKDVQDDLDIASLASIGDVPDNKRTERHIFSFGHSEQAGAGHGHGFNIGFKTGGHSHGFGPIHHGHSGYNGNIQVGPVGAGAGVSNVMNFVPNLFGWKKSGTKDSRESTMNFLDNARQQLPPIGSCRQPLKLPRNSVFKCRKESCEVGCQNNYVFPDGKSQLSLMCINSEWIIRDSEWLEVPPCQPTCVPACMNNGICLEPGLCKCPENFYGPICQNRKLMCPTKPRIPKNSKVSCKNSVCNVECMRGFQFPDGTGITNLECINGEWRHTKSGQLRAPDCAPICDPPCDNGGKCISFNVCQCSKTHRGAHCQYDINTCNITKFHPKLNANYKCSYGNEEAKCLFSCPEGIQADGSLTTEYKCKYSSGEFYPRPLPMCIYPKGYKVIPKGFSSSMSYKPGDKYYSYSNGNGGDEPEVETSIEVITKWKKKNKMNEFYSSSEEFFESPGVYSLYFGQEVNVIQEKAPKPAICSTWGGKNIKTFDGLVFKAPISCSHTLLTDKIDATFDVTLKACPYGSGYSCPHSIKIFWQSILYTFENSNGTIRLYTPQKNLPIPVQVMGMKVIPIAQQIQIELDSVGIRIFWDKHQYIAVEAGPGLWSRAGGLCGSLDGDFQNDFMSKEGVALKTSKAFTDSWKIPDDSSLCLMENSGEVDKDETCDANTKKRAEAVCIQLLSNAKLTECVKPFNMNALMKCCIDDYCGCANKEHPESCNCDALAVLAKECVFNGIKLEHGWRNLEICPINCNYGRVYLPCGPSIEPTCDSPVVTTKGACNEGCFCPEGTVQYNDSCISPELCPCNLRNKEFKAGSTVKKDCNDCVCKNGIWKCTDDKCGARCGAIGDPHYMTFDGKKFDFMGKCSYYLLKTSNLSVEAENVACSGTVSESMNIASATSVTSSAETSPSCTKSVTVRFMLNGVETTVKLGQNLVTHVNNKEILKFPKVLGNGDVLIRQASSTIITVELADGIRIWWDGVTRAYIDAPPSYRDRTAGLCGTFNSNTQDDFLTPEGDIETAVEPFADKWRTKDSCDFVSDTVSGPHPCQQNPQNRAVAEKHCAWITEDIFMDCHWSVDPEQYYEDCMYDVCACKEDPAKCFCPILAAYGAECTRQGIKTGWRYSVKECAISCPVGQTYDECGDSCTRTCEDLATKNTCQTDCVEGCRCPHGEYLDDKNECVPAKKCPCTFDGVAFKTGYKEVRPGRQFLELCTCEGGIWECDMAEPGDKETYPPSSELRAACANRPFAEFSKCVATEPRTCKNMHDYVEKLDDNDDDDDDCAPGCACMKGYVYDTSKKECVQPENCSCHHAGKSYNDGDQIKEDCNVCLCKSGNWQCTTNGCESTCSVWGDSHFTTFDNHDFDFQGACDYILSKGVNANGDGYTITIQNVLCGTLGVTCSKSVEIALSGSITDSITLSADSSYLEDSRKSPINRLRDAINTKAHTSFNIYKAGIFIVVEIIPLKLQVKWDEGTSVYVKLGNEWKNKVSGLCGNYNDNANDDMKTPSQGLETSPLIFGHSWKLQTYCTAPTQPIDACKVHPERETWAQLKCGVLKSSLFKECHAEVPVEKYLKRCIFDTCACDQGGDCECLCTAIAAYAHSCSMKGIAVRWRTPHFCPMQCDPHCSDYDSCTPACAIETCDNFLDQGLTDRMCTNENCLEGCHIKPCDDGMIYLNDTFSQCVPKSECKPLCMQKDGKIYYEGDVTVSDACQTCRCSKKKEVCSGVPCVEQILTTVKPIKLIEAATSTTSLPMRTEEQIKCIAGWTRWFNQDQDSTHTLNRLKLNDAEKLPHYDRFESIYGTCEKKYMQKIECRVLETHEDANLMDENVFCRLSDGLACVGQCHDYEIRVFCKCDDSDNDELAATTTTEKSIEKPLTGAMCDAAVLEYKEYPGDCYKFLHCQPLNDGVWEYVEKTCGPSMMYNPIFNICDHIASVQLVKPICGGDQLVSGELTEAPFDQCPPGKVWYECANRCEHTCHYFGTILRKRGLCHEGEHCKAGCMDNGQAQCSKQNKLWRDENTCVDIEDCPCMDANEKYVQPHMVVPGETETCQCIDNHFLCERNIIPIETTTTMTTQLYTEDIFSIITESWTSKPLVIPTTVTPPISCPPERMMPMISGDQPLPDSVFGASSVMGTSFMPQYARLHAKPIGKSKGSWSPMINDQMQYLQVSFDEPEPLFGVVMQGSPIFDQYVTLFKILHSHDGVAFHYLVDETDKPQMFNGPIDSRTPVQTLFKIPIEAKVVRIYPLKWHGSISMRVELLGCAEVEEETTTMPTTTVDYTTEVQFEKMRVKSTDVPPTTTTTSWQFEPECKDYMGVENGNLSPSQVEASSVWTKPKKGKKPHLLNLLKLSSPTGWKPILNTPNEFIEFDFMEPRNISGIKTKGGPDGWVTGYKIMYSKNKPIWNNVLSKEGIPKVFIANHDHETPQTIYFRFPIQTQFIKIVPLKWEDNINMRVEPVGCFLPYPEIKETVELIAKKPAVKCLICDNIATNPKEKKCKCAEPLYWDGSGCVTRNMCPCVENYISYPIGSKFENKHCQECVCVLGGVAQCKPKKCPPCEDGLRPVQTATCFCKCEPCPEMQKLCKSSGDCIPESLWCNGVKDCEDDEPDECTMVIKKGGEPLKQENTTITKTCPVPECPPNMKMKIIQNEAEPKMSDIFKSTVTKQFSTYRHGSKIIRTKIFNSVEEYLPMPQLEDGFNEIEHCAEFICAPIPIKNIEKNITISCPLPKCPPNYEIELDNSNSKPGECQKYSCILRPQKDDVCEISGKSFTTFDGTEFKYATCSHILARDLINSTWAISVHLQCTDESRKICRKMIAIKDMDSSAILTIKPDMKVNFNGFDYTVQQLEHSAIAKVAFIISQPGNTILVVSRTHGFWVSYDEVGLIKIGVSSKFIKTVDGLCGYYNDIPGDDKRTPDGTITASTNKFGDSWFDMTVPKEECYPEVCPRDLQVKSLALCNAIKHPTFLKCGKAVNYKQFVSKCIETTCECLQANKQGDSNACKCSILQGFVKQCLTVKPNVQLDNWRAIHQCEISCPAPLVHSDCYKRRCEPSCDSIHGDDCPVLPDACFSGCYCPQGTVRKGETCVPVAECKDCICDSFGTSKYVTYDRKNFTFNGNCTYLLTRDMILPGVHTFQVYVTMDDCKKLGRTASGDHTSCTKSLHILNGDHVIHIQRIPGDKALEVFVDGMEVKTLPYKDSWIGVRISKGKELILTLPESHVELTSAFDDMAFSIGVPSIKYGGKMEGLCGDCNGDPSDDLKMNPQKSRKPSTDIMEIINSWQASEPKLGLDPNECLSEEVPLDNCIPLPPEKDPCMKFFDDQLFGKCHMIVDPIMYVSSCQQDMCKPGNDQKGACESLSAYAHECARNGICLNWRSLNLCPYDCPAGMMYEPCGCTKTCESVKATEVFDAINMKTNTVVKTMTPDAMCLDADRDEGCFCPPGKVLDGGKCVTEEQCVKCDEVDRHPGDVWQKDKCTECTCSKDGKTECLEQKCLVQESICSEGFTPSKVSSTDECCPRYICLPELKVPPPITCPDAPLPECGPGQYKKQKTGVDGCPQFICECKPVSECDPLLLPRPLKAGEKAIQENSGCCPVQEIICDKTSCPPAPAKCEEKFFEVTTVMHPGDCCPTHKCAPPKDACIVSYQPGDEWKFLKKLGDKWLHSQNPCKHEFCAYGPNDTTQVITTNEECDTKCPLGFTYALKDSTRCCGECYQTECVFEGKLFKPKEKWQSPDNCTAYACIEKEWQLIVSSLKESCPDVSDCPVENLIDEGCCKTCKMVPLAQKNCMATSLAENETKNLIKVMRIGHGNCVNVEPIIGFTECYGSCNSGTRYNALTYGHDKICNCCNIESYKTIKIPLICEDGSMLTKDIEIPSSCGCSSCMAPLIDIRSAFGAEIKKLVRH